MQSRVLPSAVPEAPNAIRLSFDEAEPPALVFHEQAAPGALVSWAWCQLTALDTLLVASTEAAPANTGERDVAGAVRTVIGPVINALAFSERRASEVECERKESRVRLRRRRRGREK